MDELSEYDLFILEEALDAFIVKLMTQHAQTKQKTAQLQYALKLSDRITAKLVEYEQ